MPGLHVERLTKAYKKKLALNELTFQAPEGWRVLGVLGRNGAGKTTLLKILVGLLEKDSGRVRLFHEGKERDVLDPGMAFFVAEGQNLPEYMTGRDYLAVVQSLNWMAGVAVDIATQHELFNDFELRDALRIPVWKMSKGMRRKLELVAALSTCVPVVVADEMPEGLDVPSMDVLASAIGRLANVGKRFIVSTHDLAFIQKVSDTVLVVDEGSCQATISTAESGQRFEEQVLAAFRN